MLPLWDKETQKKGVFLEDLEVYRADWLGICGLDSRLACNTRSLHRIKYAPPDPSTRLVPAPRQGTASILMRSHAA